VLVENFRPGVSDRLGIGYGALRARNPRLVFCALSGYGASGPDRELKAFDLIQAPWEGCLSISGEAGAAERAWYQENDIPIFPWSSLAGGFFSGRFRRDNQASFESSMDRLCVETYCVEDNFARLDRARELAERKGAAVPQIALAYVLGQPLDAFALVGCQSGAEFRENVGALDLRLSREELAWLELGKRM